MAVAYGHLPEPDRAANLQEAIRGLQEAIDVYTESSYSEEWANTMRLLGNAYADMRAGYSASGDVAEIKGAAPEEQTESSRDAKTVAAG
jgi:hypothetical protein